LAQTINLLAQISKPQQTIPIISMPRQDFVLTPSTMSKENNEPTFEGREPSMLFRQFAAECMELAQSTPLTEKRTLYMKMASVWHQMALRWEKK
jgi:hypothetical protein